MDDELKAAIEAYIDKYCAESVLYRVAEVCHAKAEHLRSAWQDMDTAKVWTAQARSIEYAASMAKRRGL